MATPLDSRPPVSVVIPVWDAYADGFLDEALASIVAEAPVAQVIVVDNASNTPVAPKVDQVMVVRTPTRLSCGAARNFGLRAVHAPLVVMWDADDVMIPGTLDHLCEGLVADPRMVANAAAIVDSPTGVRHRWPRRWVSLLTRRPRLLAVVNSVWSQYPTTGATIMRTDVVRQAGGYGESESGDDWSLGVALLWRGRVGWSERPGRHYRQHAASLWKAHCTTRHLLEHSRVVRESLQRDSAVPRWCQAAMPLIQLGQYVAILVVRPLSRVFRRHGRTR